MSKHLSVSYSKAGDLLKVYWDDAPSFADTPPAPRDDVVLLRALGDETRIVGCKIHDLSAVLDRAGLKLVPKDALPRVGDLSGGPTVALCSYCHLPMGSAACQEAHP